MPDEIRADGADADGRCTEGADTDDRKTDTEPWRLALPWDDDRGLREKSGEWLTGVGEAETTGDGGSDGGGWEAGVCGGEDGTTTEVGGTATTEDVFGFGREWGFLVEVLSVVAGVGTAADELTATAETAGELEAAVVAGTTLWSGAPAW
jgi:hypothetical protein